MPRGADNSSAPPAALRGLGEYFAQSERPLTCLLFIAPLLVLYEVGTAYFASDPYRHTEQRIIAFSMMREFFGAFGIQSLGAVGRHLPALAVVAILLFWHLARKDPWTLRFGTSLGMIVESAVLAVPLFVVSALVRHYVPIMTAGASGGEAALASSSDILLAATAPDWRGMVVLSLGAGIYEELVFRLIAFAALSLVFVDLLKGDRRRAGPLIVVVAAVLFALYHYKGPEAFTWPTFVFRTVAGLYFGVVFLVRGFGVTVGSHAAYDIIIVGLAYGRSAH